MSRRCGVRLPVRWLAIGVGRRSRPGWGQAGYQRNFTLRLDPRQLRNFLFSGRFQELPSAYRACRPNLRKEIAVAISVEDQFRLGLRLLRLRCGYGDVECSPGEGDANPIETGLQPIWQPLFPFAGLGGRLYTRKATLEIVPRKGNFAVGEDRDEE